MRDEKCRANGPEDCEMNMTVTPSICSQRCMCTFHFGRNVREHIRDGSRGEITRDAWKQISDDRNTREYGRSFRSVRVGRAGRAMEMQVRRVRFARSVATLRGGVVYCNALFLVFLGRADSRSRLDIGLRVQLFAPLSR